MPRKTKATLIAEIRTAVADYIRSEGCSCCADGAAHEAARRTLGELLDVPGQPDPPFGVWHDFTPYQSHSVTESP